MKKEEMEELCPIYSQGRIAHKYIVVNKIIMPSLNILVHKPTQLLHCLSALLINQQTCIDWRLEMIEILCWSDQLGKDKAVSVEMVTSD